MMARTVRARAAASIAIAAALASACGGRARLVPAYQIGWLSRGAVVANGAGVRVLVRTDEWPGPSLESAPIARIFPVEITFDNRSQYDLEVGRQHVLLVGEAGQPVAPWVPPESPSEDATLATLAMQALRDSVVAPGERATGFVYFQEPQKADGLLLRIELVASPTHMPFGSIDIPFSLE